MSKFGDLIGRKPSIQPSLSETVSSPKVEITSIKDIKIDVNLESNKVVDEIVLDLPKQVKQKNSWKKMKKNKS